MRAWLSALTLLVAAVCFGQPSDTESRVLILIDRKSANPPVDVHTYFHGQWIQWARPSDSLGNNRLLSLVSGVDWQGDPSDLLFRPGRETGSWRSANFEKLRSRGHFEAERDYLHGLPFVSVRSGDGRAAPAVLALGLRPDSPTVRPVGLNEVLPRGSVLVFQAKDWNEVAILVGRAKSRALVLEYPPDPFGLGQCWFQGRGWPSGLPVFADVGVAGLIPAKKAIGMLSDPATADWQTADLGPWGDAHRWVDHIRFSGPVVLGIVAFLGAYIIGCAVYYILKEERAPIASWLLRSFSLTPAVLVLGGQWTHVLGIQQWMLAMSGSLVAVLLAWWLADIATRRLAAAAHPFFSNSLAGLCVVSAFSPLWSFFSPVLSSSGAKLSGEAAGALLLYLAGVCVLLPAESKKGPWFARGLCLAYVLWGALANPWWVSGEPGMLLLPVVAWLGAERWLRLPAMAALAIVADPTFRAIRHGWTYAPGGLLPTYQAREALNLGHHVAFLMSIPLVMFVVSVAMLGFAGDRFLFHQMRRAWSIDGRPRGLSRIAMAAGAMGILEPVYLPIALMVAIGALVVAIHDAAQPL